MKNQLTFNYSTQLIPLFKEWGATGLLIEWEDTFPFDGEHLDAIGSFGTDSPGLYSKEQVTEILGLAEEHRLDVIPLVQTFGHLEVGIIKKFVRFPINISSAVCIET